MSNSKSLKGGHCILPFHNLPFPKLKKKRKEKHDFFLSVLSNGQPTLNKHYNLQKIVLFCICIIVKSWFTI